jgi:hypothetical protein
VGARLAVRAGLLYLAITGAYVSIWILLAPKGFYDSFPTGPGHWVSVLPPYNEHLERDLGAAGLGLATLAAMAAVWLDHRLVQATAVAFLVSSLPHFAYHLTTTDRYSTVENVESLIGLALPALIALALLALAGRLRQPSRA